MDTELTRKFEKQRDSWIADWADEMTIDKYPELGDKLVQTGKYEEISFAISFLKSERENYSESTFHRIGNCFDLGIANWGNTDVVHFYAAYGKFTQLILRNFY